MDEKKLIELANEEILFKKDKFIEFIKKRFPDSHYSYICEWVERWNSGHPELYADNITKKALKEVGHKWKEEKGMEQYKPPFSKQSKG